MTRLASPRARDLAARVTVGALFALLSANLLNEFLRTRHLTGLLLLASESLVLVLMALRRPAAVVDRTAPSAIVTAVSLLGPPLFRATAATALAPDAVTASASAVGLAIVIAGKLALGRSFGIVPANRGVVCAGPYAFVRHPIYTGYLITHVAFVIAHPDAWNIAVLATADTALVIRAMREECVLLGDAAYRAYCGRVGWHLVPGVF